MRLRLAFQNIHSVRQVAVLVLESFCCVMADEYFPPAEEELRSVVAPVDIHVENWLRGEDIKTVQIIGRWNCAAYLHKRSHAL